MQNDLDIFPDVIRIEPSGKCNFKCIHCPTGNQPNSRQFLKNDQFMSIIKQFVDNDFIPRVVVLYHGGEPLLNKKISNYIRVLKEIGVTKTHIVTNSSLLSKELSKELILSGLDEIHTSFDGENAEENNIIRKNGDFYKNASNVKDFCKLRNNLGYKKIRILISNVRIVNKKKLSANYKNGQFAFQDIPLYLTQYFEDEFHEIEFQSFPAMVWPGLKEIGVFEQMFFPEQKPKYCASLFETTTILSNGNVVPCCFDLNGEVIFGNVFTESIFDIWMNQKYSIFRKNFKNRIYSKFCSKCKVVSPRYLCER